MSAVADRLEAHAAELAARSITIVWKDPFWDARFGARGLAFATEDGGHHVTWVCEALRAGTPEPLRTYARWLRGVLTTRGMCSLHLAEHFTALGTAIGELGLDPEGLTDPLLAEACAALIHERGPAAEVDAAAAAIAPQGRVLASYLADALAHGRPELFVRHVQFLRSIGDPADEALHDLAESVPTGHDIVRLALETP